jgi:hypothetical protein
LNADLRCVVDTLPIIFPQSVGLRAVLNERCVTVLVLTAKAERRMPVVRPLMKELRRSGMSLSEDESHQMSYGQKVPARIAAVVNCCAVRCPAKRPIRDSRKSGLRAGLSNIGFRVKIE